MTDINILIHELKNTKITYSQETFLEFICGKVSIKVIKFDR